MEKQNNNVGTTATQRHVLFDLTPLDTEVEEIEEKTRKSYHNVKQMITGKSAKECQDIYHKHITSNPQSHTEELTMGLLVAILIEPEGQSDYFRDIVSFSKDNLNLFGTYLNMIIIERASKVSVHSIKQIFWVTNQLMKAGTTSAETTCSNLMRQVAGGDLSPKNLLMVESLIDLLSENRSWLINSSQFMGPLIIYNFMRLVADHMAPAQSTLRQKEIDFVIGIIRERFDYVVGVGKDFLRLLNCLTKVPEFEKLHNDIYNNPKALHPKYEGPQQLLLQRTPRRLFQSRLTFDMERKISFFAQHVKFGNHKRYQDWFHKQYLSTPESLSLRCDLIRYICTIIHPSNEVLCSDIIPRWAIIGWLLATCSNGVSAAASRQALFFDWFTFEAKTDNIMNIEPAILVMYYSLRSHPLVTSSLLDYLCRIPSSFAPKLTECIKAGIKKSLQQILEKRVIQSLAPLFDNPRHDPGLKALIRESFPEFCGSADNGMPHVMNNIATGQTSSNPDQMKPMIPDHGLVDPRPGVQADSSKLDTRPNKIHQEDGTAMRTSDSNDQTEAQKSKLLVTRTKSSRVDLKSASWNGTENLEPTYSPQLDHDNNNKGKRVPTTHTNDFMYGEARRRNCLLSTEEEITYSQVHDDARELTREIQPSQHDENGVTSVIYPFMTVQKTISKEVIKTFDESIRNVLNDFPDEVTGDYSNRERCSAMDKLISAIIDSSEQSIKSPMFDDLGCHVANLLSKDYVKRIFVRDIDNNAELEKTISLPFFLLCRSAFAGGKGSQKPLALLVSVGKYFEATGFLVMYFLRVNFVVYGKAFASNLVTYYEVMKKNPSLSLLKDLEMAATYDSELFCYLLPNIFSDVAACGSFSVTSNPDLIRLALANIDPPLLEELIYLCMAGSAKVISREDPLPIIESSLNWDSWEQYCFWKFVEAQLVPVNKYISILSKITSQRNSEAMSCITLELQKLDELDGKILQAVIDKAHENQLFSSSLLRRWAQKTDMDELAKSIASLADSRPPSPQVKRKGQQKSSTKASPPSTLSDRSEKILLTLEAVRSRTPRSKLLAHPVTTEMLSQLEPLCNDAQKKKFGDLFLMKVRATKKRKTEKETSA